ncbi:MAG TPA: hypothetical protein VIK26_11215 [Clostridium sp.]
MESGFRRIFWGMLFIFVEFKIGNVDVLPNFLGAYLVYSGCNRLKDREDSFNRVINVAKLLTVLEIIKFVAVLAIPFTNNSQMWQSMIMTFGDFCLGIMNLYILYYIFKGIYNIAAENDFRFLMDNSNFRWKLKFYSFLLGQMLVPFVYNLESSVITIPILILTIIQFVADILILASINTAKKELAQLD